MLLIIIIFIIIIINIIIFIIVIIIQKTEVNNQYVLNNSTIFKFILVRDRFDTTSALEFAVLIFIMPMKRELVATGVHGRLNVVVVSSQTVDQHHHHQSRENNMKI